MFLQIKFVIWRLLTLEKFGCQIHSLGTRKLQDFTRFLLLISTSGYFLMETSFTASGDTSGILSHNLILNLIIMRTSLKCACSMFLARFPLDQQTCHLNLASCENSKKIKIFCYIILNVVSRWVDQEWSHLCLETRGSPPDCQQSQSARYSFKKLLDKDCWKHICLHCFLG